MGIAIGVVLRRTRERYCHHHHRLSSEVLLPHQGIYKIFSTLLIRQVPPHTRTAFFCLQNFSYVHQANFTYSVDDITETAYLKIEFGPAGFRIAPEGPMKKGGHHI